jgi:endonuclease III
MEFQIIGHKKIEQAIIRLRQLYERLLLELEAWKHDLRDPYRVLILMGLSGATDEGRLTDVCQRFFALWPTQESFLKEWEASPDRIFSIVILLGRLKTNRKLLQSAASLIKQYGSIPKEREVLLHELGWNWEATVEKLVGYAYGEPALPADSHICRVYKQVCQPSLRSDLRQDSQIRRILKAAFQPNEWMEVHELLRLHGQAVCSNNPFCSWCNVNDCSSGKAGEHWENARTEAEKVVARWRQWRKLLLKVS